MLTRWRFPPERLRDLLVGALLQARLGEHPRDGRLDVGDAVEPREQPQVLRDAELAVEGGLLRHPADARPSAPDGARVRLPGCRRGSSAASSCRRRSARCRRPARRRGPRAKLPSESATRLAVALAQPAGLEHGAVRRVTATRRRGYTFDPIYSRHARSRASCSSATSSASPGGERCSSRCPALRERHSPDLVVANGENIAGGLGITRAHGAQVCSTPAST